MIIAPIDVNTNLVTHNKTNIRLSTNDKRAEPMWCKLLRVAATPIALTAMPRPILYSATPYARLTQQGYVLSQQTGSALNLDLESVVVNVEQSAMSYKALSLASATLTVHRNNQQLIKRYQAKGQTTGAMSIDTASLEREVNDRLSQLLHAMLNDAEVHQFIR